MKWPKGVKTVSFKTIDRLTLHCPHEHRNAMVAMLYEEGYSDVRTHPLPRAAFTVSNKTTVIVAEKEHERED